MQEIPINAGDEVYIMPSTSRGIQICSGCHKKAANQVDGENRRMPVIPKGRVMKKFQYTGISGGLRKNINDLKGGKNTYMIV